MWRAFWEVYITKVAVNVPKIYEAAVAALNAGMLFFSDFLENLFPLKRPWDTWKIVCLFEPSCESLVVGDCLFENPFKLLAETS